MKPFLLCLGLAMIMAALRASAVAPAVGAACPLLPSFHDVIPCR
jgi:hypothetical protein